MSRVFTHILRIVAAVIFVWAFLFFIFGMFYNENLFTLDAIIGFFTNLKDLVASGLYMLLYYAPQGTSMALSAMFGSTSPEIFDATMVSGLNGGLLNWYILQLFSFPAKTVTDASNNVIGIYYMRNIHDANNYIKAAFDVLVKDVYSLVFIVLGITAIINAILFVTRMRGKYSLNAVMSMTGMVILPLTILGFQQMLGFFGTSLDALANLPFVLRPEIIEPISEGWEFFTMPMFSAILLIYLFVELSFQVEYSDLVTKPSQEREMRLRYQLDSLQREGMRVTTTIEKVQAEAREQKKITGNRQNRLKQFFSKAGGFSYVKEMVEKRKFERATQAWLEAASDTRRLGSYVQRLTTEDPEARRTLTAKSSSPTAGKMLISTLVNILIRTVAIITLTFIVSQPQFILTNLFTGFGTLDPPLENWAILYSAELATPEAILVLLIPFVTIFPMASLIIKKVKSQRLKELLRQEELRRQAVEQSIFSARPAESASTTTNVVPPTGTEEESKELQI
ncbi:MAG: hypothetical protein RBG13Loki_0973 [Promethearchaeota archaeon CR_4]|nr:MAG: hypothetical protein RBG13Loki_0973 [Candidatus Lokiarchaeota archaeon CR_4]